jgi:RNA polymerase sigma factor (sigma-70 family)
MNPSEDPRSDAELMTAFRERRDQRAFATVVRRHERLVLNACARVLGDVQEAADAAQAAFLALAMKADELDFGRPLAPWLHRAAYGAAVSALRSRRAREAREREVAAMGATSEDPAWSEMRGELDRELDALPERYRKPIVLFHLEGMSMEETASELRSNAGTVGAWLSRGRELLRDRLVRRGVGATSVAVLAALLSSEASALAPAPGFAAWTAKAAASGSGAGLVTAEVVGLAKGTLNMMLWTKVKAVLTASFCALGALGVGGGALALAKSAPAPAPRVEVSDSFYRTTAAVAAPEPEVEIASDAVQAEPATGSAQTSDLLGLWKLDEKEGEKLEDSSGRGHHGKLIGTAARVEGKLGGGAKFDGSSNSYGLLPHTPELDKVQEGSYTLAAWFCPDVVPPGREDANDANFGIVMKQGWHEGLHFNHDGQLMMTHWLAPEVWAGVGTWDTSYEAGKWVHVAGVVDPSAGTTAIYVDGELKQQAEWETKGKAKEYKADDPWRIGTGCPTAEKWAWNAKAKVDDVRIYKRALSPMEIKAIYEAK